MSKRFPEHVLQVQCKIFCKEAIDAPHSFQAFDRSSNGSGVQHMYEANRGIRKGQPDTLIIYNGWAIYCELKAPGNKPTSYQEEMGLEIRRAGGHWFWANSVVRYMDGLAYFGVHFRPNARLIAEHREGLFQGYLLKDIVPRGVPKRTPPPSLDRVRRTNALRRKIAFAFVLAFLSAPAFAHPATDPNAEWFRSLTVPDGRSSCCGGEDVEECKAVDYRMTAKGYEVYLKKSTFPDLLGPEGWRVVPDSALILRHDNPTGSGQACVFNGNLRCFVPAVQG
jgi:hypothetical protein